jgi:hypothetical protein
LTYAIEEKSCKMMLQPTSGRQGFDYVSDQTDEKGK